MSLADHIKIPTPGTDIQKASTACRVFTPENRATILASMDTIEGEDHKKKPGLTLKHAAALAGLSWHTVDHWVKDGLLQLAFWEGGGPVNGNHLDLMEFAREVKKRQAANEALLVSKIVDAVDKNNQGLTWQGAATLLERQNPDDFGQVQKQEVKVEQNTEIKITWHRANGQDWTDKNALPPGLVPAITDGIDDIVDTTFADG